MSVTIAHRPHVQAPWLPIALTVAVAAAAVLFVWLVVDEPATTSQPTTVLAAGPAAPAVTLDVPKNRSAAVRAFRSAGATAASIVQAPASSLKMARAPWVAGEAR